MDLENLPRPPAEVLRAHEAAERTLLAAAVAHSKAKAHLRERGGLLSARQAAAGAHMALDAAALAYGEAHAALVAAS